MQGYICLHVRTSMHAWAHQYMYVFLARPKRRVGRNALALDSQAARRRQKQTRGDDGRNARALDNQCYVARYTQKWQEGDVAEGKGCWTKGVVYVVGGVTVQSRGALERGHHSDNGQYRRKSIVGHYRTVGSIGMWTLSQIMNVGTIGSGQPGPIKSTKAVSVSFAGSLGQLREFCRLLGPTP